MAGPSGTTAKLALPYPVPDDSVDVPRDVQALAVKLDPLVATEAEVVAINTALAGKAGFSQGTLAARPAAGTAGRLYYATDKPQLYYDTGSAWTAVSVSSIASRTLYGIVSATGTIINGGSGGWTASGASGTYQVYFTVPFGNQPIVVVCPFAAQQTMWALTVLNNGQFEVVFAQVPAQAGYATPFTFTALGWA
jgi:hypothetical protein